MMKSNWIKRVAAVIMSAALCCTMFAGCGEKEDTAGPLTVYAPARVDKQLVAQATDKFRLLYPDVDVEVERLYSSDDAEEQQMFTGLQTRIMAGSGPDVILVDNSFLYYCDINKVLQSGTFIDLNKYFEKDESWSFDGYNTAVIDAAKVDGKQYLMPLYYDTWFLLSEKSLLEKYGFDVSACSTGKGLLEEMAKYYEKAAEDESMPLLLQYSDSWYEGLLDVMQLNPLDYNTGKVTWSPEFTELLDCYKRLYPFDKNASIMDYYDLSAQTKYGADWLNQEFSLLYGFFGHLDYMGLKNLQQVTGFGEPVVLPFYSYDGSGISAEIRIAAGITASSPRKQMAYDFIKCLMDEKAMIQELAVPGAASTQTTIDAFSTPINEGAAQKLLSKHGVTRERDIGDGSGNVVLKAEALDQSILDKWDELNHQINHVFYYVGNDGSVLEYFDGYLKGEESYDTVFNKAQSTFDIYISE